MTLFGSRHVSASDYTDIPMDEWRDQNKVDAMKKEMNGEWFAAPELIFWKDEVLDAMGRAAQEHHRRDLWVLAEPRRRLRDAWHALRGRPGDCFP